MHNPGNRPGAIGSAVVLAISLSTRNAAALDQDTRIAAQRALERISFAHTAWPAGTPGKRPEFSALHPVMATDDLAPTITTWAKNFGTAAAEFFVDVEPALDGGFVVLGTVSSDLVVLRLDSAGGVAWGRRLGGAGTEYGKRVRPTSDGGVVVLAETGSFGAGGLDVWVVKLNSAGGIVWQKAYGKAGIDHAGGIVEKAGGGYWLGATIGGNAVVLELDASGTPVAQRSYQLSGHAIVLQEIRATSNGGLLLAGAFGYDPGFNATVFDPVVVKLDSGGNVVWSTRFFWGSVSTFTQAVVSASGGATVLLSLPGQGAGPPGPTTDYLVELNSTGALVWRKQLDPSDSATGFDRTPDGGTITAHVKDHQVGVVSKVDATGVLQWSLEYGQSHDPVGAALQSVRSTVGGGYVIGGSSPQLAPGDLWIARTDDAGAVNAPCQVAAAGSVAVQSSSVPSLGSASVAPLNATSIVTTTAATSSAYAVESGVCVNADDDGDNVPNTGDNCPTIDNSAQENSDGDAFGDVCDPCPMDPGNDADGDGRCANVDNCPAVANAGQQDADADGVGDACDVCPLDADDSCATDADGDRVPNDSDNCPDSYNETQSDFDHDGVGDACDLDDGYLFTYRPGKTSIAWQYEPPGSQWNIYFGDLSTLRSQGLYTQAPGSNALASRQCALDGIIATDPSTPQSGSVAFSLVTAVVEGVERSLGSDSHGTERPNANPCP